VTITANQRDAIRARRAVLAGKLIQPLSTELRDCLHDIETAIIELDHLNSQFRHSAHDKTKPAKKAASSFAELLLRVEYKRKDQRLDLEILKFFPWDVVSKWKLILQKLASTPSGKLKRKTSEAKKRAVSEALLLMHRYNSKKIEAKLSTSPFCRLASLLFDGGKTNLHNQCRAALRKKRGRK
jgi:hypothetical protein